MWPLPQKHGYHPKPEFYRRGFLKFDRLVFVPKGRYRLSNVSCGTAATAATNMMFESLRKNACGKLEQFKESDWEFLKIFGKFGGDFMKICNKYQKNFDAISETF